MNKVFEQLYKKDETGTSENTNLTIRIPKTLIKEFQKVCEEKNVTVSFVLRKFIESQISTKE